MKQLLLPLLFFVSMSTEAQSIFPTKDSAISFVNKYIRNSAINAFTNNRMNTSLRGIIGLIGTGSSDTTDPVFTGEITGKDGSNRTVTKFSNSGRLDLTDFSGAGGILVLRNDDAPEVNQIVGHIAFYGKNDEGGVNAIGTVLAQVKDFDNDTYSSQLQLGYSDNQDQSGSSFPGQYQPNKIVYISSAGLQLPNIIISGAAGLFSAGTIRFTDLPRNSIITTDADGNLTNATRFTATDDLTNGGVARLGTRDTYSAEVELLQQAGAPNLLYGMRMISTGQNAGKIEFASSATAVGSQVYNSTALAFADGAVSALKINRTAVANTNATMAANHYLVAWTSLSAARTYTLGNAADYAGRHFILKDESGAAGANNISIVGTINGTSNPTSINSNYGTYKFYSNGTAWFSE